MNKNLKGLILVTLFSISWAIDVTISKIALNRGIEPLSFTYQTLLLGGIIALTYILVFQRKELKKLFSRSSKKSLLGLISSGVLTGAATILIFFGLKLSSASNYGFLIKTTVIFTVILAAIFLGERFTWKKVFFVFLTLLGAYLISTNGSIIYPKVGDLITLFAALFIASANIVTKPLLKYFSSESLAFVRAIIGGLTVLIVIPFILSNFWTIHSIGLVILRSIFFFTTVVLVIKTINATSLSYMTLMSTMFSLFVLVIGLIFFKESFSIIQLFGGLIILISAVLIHKANINLSL